MPPSDSAALRLGLERIGIAIGRAFGPALGDAAEKFAVLAERFAYWAEKHPGMIKSIGVLVGGFAVLRIASASFGLLFGEVMRKVVGVLTGGLWRAAKFGVGRLASMMLTGLARLAPFLLRGLGVAFGVLSGPLGWAILAITAGALIYKFRDQIAAGWHVVVDWFKGAFEQVKATILAIDWAGIGISIMDSLTFGLASKLPALTSKLNGIGAAIAGGGAINIKPVPFGAVPPGNARARGGSVSAGQSYLVGERGRSLQRLAAPARSSRRTPWPPCSPKRGPAGRVAIHS